MFKYHEEHSSVGGIIDVGWSGLGSDLGRG